jgi:cytochrome c oxidase cbb3-type subunit 3/ubiquinol-cytochrome c reductase cytochrome c subunit
MKASLHPFYCLVLTTLGCAALLVGCQAPGKPGPAEERPEQVTDFTHLYKQNCAACHGENGQHGLAVSLNNPAYIAIAGEEAIRRATAQGGPGKLMPAFARQFGGTLTDRQVEILAAGIVQRWGRPRDFTGLTPPPYATTLSGNAEAGKVFYAGTCARCHDAVLKGTGPVTDSAYLALISDQGLRTAILSGHAEEGMPDWRNIAATPLTDQQVTDIVAWLASQRKTPEPAMPAVSTAPIVATKEKSHE